MSGTCNAAAVARHRHTQETGANEVRYGITASRELDVVIIVVRRCGCLNARDRNVNESIQSSLQTRTNIIFIVCRISDSRGCFVRLRFSSEDAKIKCDATCGDTNMRWFYMYSCYFLTWCLRNISSRYYFWYNIRIFSNIVYFKKFFEIFLQIFSGDCSPKMCVLHRI